MREKELEQLIIKENEMVDVIKELVNEKKIPLILWGAGQVANELRRYLEKKGIEITAVWVDMPSEQTDFWGIPILSLDEIKKRYNEFNVILGHSKYDLGEQLSEREEQINKVYYLVSVAYGQYHKFDFYFIKENIKKYYRTYQILEDEQSKKTMTAYLNTRINNNICYIKKCMDHEQTYFQNDIFCIGEDEKYVDIGAFNGDSIKLFLEQCHGKYNKIYAFEPDDKNFRELEMYVKRKKLESISLYKTGTWKEKGILHFKEEGQESGVSPVGGDIEVCVDTLDNILNGRPVSLIKTNFRSGLLETLMGAKDTLKNYKPKLAIVVGFDEWLLITIPQYIKRIVPEYKMYLRYNRCMPACMTLYATAEL